MTNNRRTRVKICGITNIEDAEYAVTAGADAIGLVFFEKSPRFIDIKNARHITESIAPFTNCVGLFVDATREFINNVLQEVAIDTLQFHGQESEQACNLYNKPYIKAVRMTDKVNLFRQVEKFQTARALLLDTYVKDVPGGTGKSFEWSRIPKDLNKPVILAGGLNQANVKDVILQVNPYAVDVSGGVESGKGKKDAHKMINFISETMNA